MTTSKYSLTINIRNNRTKYIIITESDCRKIVLIVAFLIHRNMTWTLVVDLTMSFPYEHVKNDESQHCKRTIKALDTIHVPGNSHGSLNQQIPTILKR